ncbi:MAG: hypothetical protein Q9166_001830 [cf. Caloplaca sp. 2 TL-2023]
MTARTHESGPNAKERIAQLSEIDRDVAKLLQSAGLAIKTMTHVGPEVDGVQGDQIQSMEQRKESFVTASSQYFSLLSSIDVRLRRHISALEHAEIIPSEATARDSQTGVNALSSATKTSSSLFTRSAARDTVTNGGLGNLDVGWLNSRNNNVEKEMEAELWGEAHSLVQKTLETKKRSGDSDDVFMDDATTSLG